MSKGLQIAVAGAAVALLLGWYAAANLDEIGTFQYFQTLEEFQASAPTDRPVRVHGYVAIGSIERDLTSRSVRFAVQNDPPHAGGETGEVLPVRYASLETPDMFKDGAEVVVEGRWYAGATPVFEADNVMAKCPSKFEAETETAQNASF